jgi:hypothetical protein
MRLAGVRRQLEEARVALIESATHAAAGALDPAYRACLRSRNLLFHATRGVAAARGEPLPEMPVTGGPGGSLDDQPAALAALDAALAVGDDLTLAPLLDAARPPYARYLGWLREAVGRLMRGS